MGIGLYQLKPDPASAQFFEGIQTVGPFHIQHRYRIGDDVARRMVVTHDEIDMFAIGISDFIHCFDTAVECDDQTAPFLFGSVDTLSGDTVPFGITVRDIVDQIIRLGTQERIHQRNRRGTVHIVVPIDHDTLIGVDGSAETINGRSHVPHQERIVQTI